LQHSVVESASLLAVQTRLEAISKLLEGGDRAPALPSGFRSERLARALELGRQSGSADLGALTLAADLLVAAAPDLASTPDELEGLIERIAEAGSLARVQLAFEVLRHPRLAELPADLALEVQLTLCRLFARVQAVSLWTIAGGGERLPIARSGSPEGTSTEIGTTFARRGGGSAALVAHGSPRGEDHRALLLDAAAPNVASILDRDAEQRASDQGVLGALERRLARLRFDLHDGPQQDVHLLAVDLNLFREQLLPMIAREPNAERILGRLDDLAAQLVALDGDLRRLASTVQSPFLHVGPLEHALREVTGAFAERAGFEPDMRLAGDFSALTESQRLTLLALIREALSNVREHSGARNVGITVAADDDGVRAEVTDDGRGFDPETTLVRAARDGHLGLVGMHERVRMLGGITTIDSRPGGPTVVSVQMPPWPEGE
jgi:signal transduction histidine kinase